MVPTPFSLNLQQNHTEGLLQLETLIKDVHHLIGIADTDISGLPHKIPPNLFISITLQELRELIKSEPTTVLFDTHGVYIRGTFFNIHGYAGRISLKETGSNTSIAKQIKDIIDKNLSIYLLTEDNLPHCTPLFYQDIPDISFTENTATFHGITYEYIITSQDHIVFPESDAIPNPVTKFQQETLAIITNTLLHTGVQPIIQPLSNSQSNPLYTPLNAEFFTTFFTDYYLSTPYLFVKGLAHNITALYPYSLKNITSTSTTADLKAAFIALRDLPDKLVPVLVGDTLLYNIPDSITSFTANTVSIEGKPYILALLYPPLSQDIIHEMFKEYNSLIQSAQIPECNRENIEQQYFNTLQLAKKKPTNQNHEEWHKQVITSFSYFKHQTTQQQLKPAELAKLKYEETAFIRRHPKEN